jgi:hypothetical protein
LEEESKRGGSTTTKVIEEAALTITTCQWFLRHLLCLFFLKF